VVVGETRQIAAVAMTGSASTIASNAAVQAVERCRLAVDFLPFGGSAESRALMMVRRPTRCLRSIARSDMPASKSRRITAYLSCFAA
jgi:hypothetical protein